MSSANATSGLTLLTKGGRHRQPATLPGRRAGIPPRNKGRRYPPQPYTTTEAFKLLQACVPESKHAGPAAQLAGLRLRAACVVMWRTGLRVQECLDLEERDLDRANRLITVRQGKGDKRRVVAMDDFGWQELDRWLAVRETIPLGPVFCIVSGDTAGDPWHQADLRRALHNAGKRAGLRRRCNPHAWRHSAAVDLWREQIDVFAISKQLGHARLDVTANYLAGLGASDLLTPISQRRPPAVPIAFAA